MAGAAADPRGSPALVQTPAFRRWLAAAAAFILAAAAVVALAGGGGGSQGSTLSRGPGGWLAARRYLVARGARVTMVSVPLSRFVQDEEGDLGRAGAGDRTAAGALPGGPSGGPGVLVLAFPWQGAAAGDLDAPIDAHLGLGGDLVVAYSGEEAGAERLLALWQWHEAGSVPLAPWRWRSFMRREWLLRPVERGGEAAAGSSPPVRIWAPRVLPQVGPGARVLYASPGGLPAVAVFRYHGGRVVLLPADALANSRLAQAGNADLLEALLRNLGPRWAFDEFHHGLVTAGGGNVALGRAADLLLAHLILLYLLAVLALARRQGPPWHEPAPIAGSAASFLLGLGALHHRLGHHREAAQLLLRRARELDRGLTVSPDLERQTANAGPRELVEIARQVARRRGGRVVAFPSAGEPG